MEGGWGPYHIRPGLVPDAEAKIGDQADGEDGGKEGIGAQVGIVAIEGTLDLALYATDELTDLCAFIGVEVFALAHFGEKCKEMIRETV